MANANCSRPHPKTPRRVETEPVGALHSSLRLLSGQAPPSLANGGIEGEETRLAFDVTSGGRERYFSGTPLWSKVTRS